MAQVVEELASGANESRRKLLALLKDASVTGIVVEQRDRLTRLGFHYLEALLVAQARQMEGVNRVENDQEEVAADLIAIVSSFTARLYGQRRAKQAKRKTEKIAADLPEEEREEREGDADTAG